MNNKRGILFKMYIYVQASILILATFPILSFAQGGADTPTSHVKYIVENRTMAEERVKVIKDNFQPSSTEYKKARSLYITAQAKFDGYRTEVVNAIRSGKRVANIENYGDMAIKANTEFCGYVDDVLSRDADNYFSIKWIPIIVESINKIYDIVSNAGQDRRDRMANQMDQYIQWKPWDKIL